MIDRPPSAAYVQRHLRALIPYVIAAAAYITLGGWEPRFLLSWIEGIVFVFIAV